MTGTVVPFGPSGHSLHILSELKIRIEPSVRSGPFLFRFIVGIPRKWTATLPAPGRTAPHSESLSEHSVSPSQMLSIAKIPAPWLHPRMKYTLIIFAAAAGFHATVATAAPAEDSYPIGAVIASGGGSGVPTEEQQDFHLRWARRQGINIFETELTAVARGWLNWGSVHVAPDRIRWDAYDLLVDDTEQAGLEVMLTLGTWRMPPAWLFEEYPDCYMHTPLGGGDELTKTVHDPDLDFPALASVAHPAVLKGSVEFARKTARRFRDRDGVRGYIIADEIGLCNVWPMVNYYGIDFSPAMRDAYHRHLKRKFGSIDKLNAAWGHPGRYQAFRDILWRREWAHEPSQYRGEWLEYYLCLQQVFADLHNQVADAIHEEDPDALVMISDYQTIGSRVGHGSYPALMQSIDAVAYKSYWHDQRMSTDFCAGISGGKQVWCTNFSEKETTTGPVEQQRYMEARYVRRQFWAAFAHGLRGAFFWYWTPREPDGIQKMALHRPLDDGSMEPINAIGSVGKLSRFLTDWWPRLRAFEPEAPRVTVVDPNLTFIGQFWNHADPNAVRAQWVGTSAISRYATVMNLMGDYDRRFTVSTEKDLPRRIKNGDVEVLCLTGPDHLPRETSKAVREWIEQGGTAILDDQAGRYSLLGEEIDALAGILSSDHVLRLTGVHWDEDDDQKTQIRRFLDNHLPQSYRRVDGSPHPEDVVTVDRMQAADGRELAVVVRRTAVGRPGDRLEIQVDWSRPHSKFTFLDPFAVVDVETKSMDESPTEQSRLTLAGYQDVILVLAE